MKYLYIFLGSLLYFCTLQAQTWEWSNPRPTGNLLYVICFTSSTTGYMAGQLGTVLKTLDGGITWFPLSTENTNNLHGISFPDENTGWVVGDNSTILKTNDAGQTWIDQSGNYTDFTSVDFPDATTGYACGSHNGYNDKLFKTTDGGNHMESSRN